MGLRAPWLLLVGSCACTDECRQALVLGEELGALSYQLCDIPEQADILLVTGRISPEMAALIGAFHQRMCAPKVLGWGACACAGGLFARGAAAALDDIVAVDAHVPGCPPRPEDLGAALRQLAAAP